MTDHSKPIARYDATRTAKDLLKALGHDDMPPNWTAKMQEDFEASVARIIQQDIEAALTARVKELEEALSKVERECRAITSEMAWDASDGRPSEAYVRTRFSDAANSINAVFDRAALNKMLRR